VFAIGHQPFAVGAESHDQHCSFEGAHLPARSEVPQLDRSVPTSACKEIAIRTEGQGGDIIVVPQEGSFYLTCGSIPQSDQWLTTRQVLVTGGGKALSIFAEGKGLNVTQVRCVESTDIFTQSHISDCDPKKRGPNQVLAVRVEGYVIYTVLALDDENL